MPVLGTKLHLASPRRWLAQRVRLIDRLRSAAGVHAGVDGVEDSRAMVSSVSRGEEGVVGDPVGAPDVDRLALHRDREGDPCKSGATRR
jgi:hypothetical protein